MLNTRRQYQVIRTSILYSLLGCGGFIILYFALVDASLVKNLLSDVLWYQDYSNLSGHAAKVRLSGDWPESVDPRDVESVSFKSVSSRNSHSGWYRIELTAESAEEWKRHVHKVHEDFALETLEKLYKTVDGVHRTIAGPRPLRNRTGRIPSWWSPPSIDFRATEIMVWSSAAARATYSAFDESTSTLWIYEYTHKHDVLWSWGCIPPGDVFLNAAEDAEQTATPPSQLTPVQGR